MGLLIVFVLTQCMQHTHTHNRWHHNAQHVYRTTHSATDLELVSIYAYKYHMIYPYKYQMIYAYKYQFSYVLQ